MDEKYPIRDLSFEEIPDLLKNINDPPKKLKARGGTKFKEIGLKFLCVVGSRKFTEYGREACESLIKNLKGYPVVIVSGLAFGIDSIAHRSALESELITISFPGSGLKSESIYPQSHYSLAMDILDAGGTLLSEFEDDEFGQQWMFPKRNRLMAGSSNATLIIEAVLKSGTLITSKLATDYNRDVLAVPGSIFSQNSDGPNMLIKMGATPVTSYKDILEILDIKENILTENTSLNLDFNLFNLDPDKKIILESVIKNQFSKDELIRHLNWATSKTLGLIAEMEIGGIIKEIEGRIYATKNRLF